MLDDIALGPFLEQPAGKYAVPLVVAIFEHEELHERAGFLRHFPLRGALAGAQADNGAADAHALSRL